MSCEVERSFCLISNEHYVLLTYMFTFNGLLKMAEKIENILIICMILFIQNVYTTGTDHKSDKSYICL